MKEMQAEIESLKLRVKELESENETLRNAEWSANALLNSHDCGDENQYLRDRSESLETQLEIARNELKLTEEELDKFSDRLEKQTDWYQQRFNRLRRWVNEEVKPLSEEVAHRYFSICANGSPAPHESADWSNTLHEYRLRAEIAENHLRKYSMMGVKDNTLEKITTKI